MLGIYFYNQNKSGTQTGTTTSIYQKFNPFGKSTETTPTTTGNEDEGIEKEPKTPYEMGSRFKQITKFAVSGAGYTEDTRQLNDLSAPEVVPSLRYVEKSTGHIYQMFLDTMVEGKISNSTIPGVYETIFDGKTTSVIYRYPSSDKQSITSFLAQLGGSPGAFLSSDILQLSLSPDKSKFFSIVKSTSGVVGVIKSFDETKTNQVFTSPFSEWLPQWVTEDKIFLNTKPSYLVEGSVFDFSIKNGTISKIFGGIPGLTTLSNNNGTRVLYGASLNIGPRLNIFDIKSHTSMDLDKYGLPEKCIWGSDNINIYCAVPNVIKGTQYPDSWYQGIVSFDDSFIKINAITKETSTMANSSNEIPVDAINLFLSKNEDKLFFINKKDYTLWSFSLK